ncbi:MAG: organoarsenical effux MFS transporter ArsJ [Methylococcales bacterium]|jgi:predicted MFS family arabinose efflux permease|nr:organoarsenical effux MFS transporter ArsJ [Methylococcales bacterium]MBT7442618.1 organoarsenical effux MFS transporter ArsJ [Methylococcales bacterium]
MSSVTQYFIVTLCYWKFTLTDGALRMLVVLYFHELGYSPLEVASLFLLYEFFGVITNLTGGWVAAKYGLSVTLNLGLILQILSLTMLLAPTSELTVLYVMVAQAISGIAKDLNKMSAKSRIKLLVLDKNQGQLFKWVAFLTGSKNTIKGLGFFLGGFLLANIGFQKTIILLIGLIVLALLASVIILKSNERAPFTPKIKHLLSKSEHVNRLSAARFFLFGARDIWFVVALPVYLQTQLQWSFIEVGTFIAAWIIGYGAIQALTPKLISSRKDAPDGRVATQYATLLSIIPVLIAAALFQAWLTEWVIIIGLVVFGIVFAVNSSLHSYLIIAYAKEEEVSLDVGFYYMANAAGRLIGTILSGVIFQLANIEACLIASGLFIAIAAGLSRHLPRAHSG